MRRCAREAKWPDIQGVDSGCAHRHGPVGRRRRRRGAGAQAEALGQVRRHGGVRRAGIEQEAHRLAIDEPRGEVVSAAIAAKHPLVNAGRHGQRVIGVLALGDCAIERHPAESEESQGRQEAHAPSESAGGLIRIAHRFSSGMLECRSRAFVRRDARNVPRLDPDDRISSVRRSVLMLEYEHQKCIK